jgi:hypothetical protein
MVVFVPGLSCEEIDDEYDEDDETMTIAGRREDAGITRSPIFLMSPFGNTPNRSAHCSLLRTGQICDIRWGRIKFWTANLQKR